MFAVLVTRVEHDPEKYFVYLKDGASKENRMCRDLWNCGSLIYPCFKRANFPQFNNKTPTFLFPLFPKQFTPFTFCSDAIQRCLPDSRSTQTRTTFVEKFSALLHFLMWFLSFILSNSRFSLVIPRRPIISFLLTILCLQMLSRVSLTRLINELRWKPFKCSICDNPF